AEVVNKSVVQSFTRSLNTTITTLIAVVIFLFFGAESIKGFSIALIAGLIAGLYSSLYLASQLWLILRSRKIKDRPLEIRKIKKVEGNQVEKIKIRDHFLVNSDFFILNLLFNYWVSVNDVTIRGATNV